MRNCISHSSTVALIFFVLVTVINCDECPPPEDIVPCSCENPYNSGGAITCKNMYTAEMISRVLRNSQGYNTREFILQNSTMQYIPNSIFEDLHFRSLVFINDTFNQLFDDVAKDPGVTSFRFNQVKVHASWDWTTFSAFTKLTTLDLENVPLRGLSNFKQHAPRSLQGVYFDNCQLRKLRKDEFQDLPNLSAIGITHDSIKELKRSMFPRPSVLYAMTFDSNEISTLPEDLFEDMQIGKISFVDNRLTVLPEKTYEPVINGYLKFQGNPIKCDCKLKWVLRKESGFILGKCDSPKIVQGRDIDELKAEDFALC